MNVYRYKIFSFGHHVKLGVISSKVSSHVFFFSLKAQVYNRMVLQRVHFLASVPCANLIFQGRLQSKSNSLERFNFIPLDYFKFK